MRAAAKANNGKGKGRGRGSGRGKGKVPTAAPETSATTGGLGEMGEKGGEEGEVPTTRVKISKRKSRRNLATVKKGKGAKADKDGKKRKGAKDSEGKASKGPRSKGETHAPKVPAKGDGAKTRSPAKPSLPKPEVLEKPKPKRARQSKQPLAASAGDVLDDLKPGMLGVLNHQWKSGKAMLTADDFPETYVFNKSTIGPYWKRARPSVGVVAKASLGFKPANNGKNKEYAHFSFPLKKVCNIGLAMHCAIQTVRPLHCHMKV